MYKKQNKTLLDVVSELPLCDRENDFGKQFALAVRSIQEWIDNESEYWEQDLLTTIPREKIGLYFLGKTKDLLDEFHDYVPYTIEDWKQMEQGEYLYYCIAMEWYMQAILMLLNHYDIEEDENQKKMFEYCWFIFDDLLDDEQAAFAQQPKDEQPTIKTIPLTAQRDIMTDRAKKYFEKAIEAGYMEKTGSGYKWTFPISKGAKAALSFFIMMVYNPDNCKEIPFKALERLFNVGRLDSAYSAMLTVKKTQEWRGMIETLFND